VAALPGRFGGLVEVELERLELLVSVQVALEMLEQDDLLVEGLGVVEEVVVLYLLLVALEARNVVEVEVVGVENDLCRIVK